MKEPKSRLLTYFGIALAAVTLVMLAVINSGLARLADAV